MLSLASAYNKSVQEESTLSSDELKTRHVGKQDPKRHLEDAVENAMGDQVCSQALIQTTVNLAEFPRAALDRAKSRSHAAFADTVEGS